MGLDVVFDLDGTIVDSVGICTDLMNEMLRARGSLRSLTSDQVRCHISVGGARMISTLFGTECGDPDLEIAEFRARYAAVHTPASSLFGGARESLMELAGSGARLTICSNKPQGLCEKALRDLELEHLFEVVVGSDGSRPAKPDPAPFLKVLELVGGSSSRAIYVGDAELDHAMARNVGVAFILMTHGYLNPGVMLEDAVRCDSFARLPTLVSRVSVDIHHAV